MGFTGISLIANLRRKKKKNAFVYVVIMSCTLGVHVLAAQNEVDNSTQQTKFKNVSVLKFRLHLISTSII